MVEYSRYAPSSTSAMDPSLMIGAAVFALVASITPGPNNVLLAASGLTFGFRRTLPLVLGIEVGFLLLLLAVAVGLGAIFERLPWLQLALRVVGVTYLLCLAWSLWRSSATGGATLDRPLGFAWGAMFQLVNPKGWMMTISAISAYTLAGSLYWSSVGMLVAAFFLMGLPSILLWALFGSALRTTLANPRQAQLAGRIMAVLTALSCVLIVI